MGYFGKVFGRLLDELRAQCFESLVFGIRMTDDAPFDITDPVKSVIFHLLECQNDDGYDLAERLIESIDTFEKIIEAIQQ